MTYQEDAPSLARKHLDRRLAPSRKSNDLRRPPRGWIRAIREALGMTTAQLAARVGVAQPWITRLETTEINDNVTLKTLRRVAEGLECELVYAFVPRRSLDDTVRRQAEIVAERQLARTNQTMKLENQALHPRDLAADRRRLVESLLAEHPHRLWGAK